VDFNFKELKDFKFRVQKDNLVLKLLEDLEYDFVEKEPTFNKETVEKFVLK